MKSEMALDEAQAVVANFAPRSYYVEQYRAWEQTHFPFLWKILGGADVRGTLLDIGPGWGTMPVWASSWGWDVTCIDVIGLDEDAAYITRDLLDYASVRYEELDIEMSFLDEEFDVVVMSDVIQHLRGRPDGALFHAKQMVRGAFVCATQNPLFHPASYQQATYGDDWRSMPLAEVAPPVHSPLTCSYSAKTFRELMLSVFGDAVEISGPAESRHLFGVWRSPSRDNKICYQSTG